MVDEAMQRGLFVPCRSLPRTHARTLTRACIYREVRATKVAIARFANYLSSHNSCTPMSSLFLIYGHVVFTIQCLRVVDT